MRKEILDLLDALPDNLSIIYGDYFNLQVDVIESLKFPATSLLSKLNVTMFNNDLLNLTVKI